MKLSISNIAWEKDYDNEMLIYLKEQKFEGLEIAPTRVFSNDPYNQLEEAKVFAEKIKKQYDLIISSMQSIWYGRTEKIFGTEEERKILLDYTKKAIDFASVTKCNNIVFGCPKNRVINEDKDKQVAIEFFYELGEYAKIKNTILSIEPNPTLYNTNFINYTSEAFDFVKLVNSDGLKVNVDLGTIIYNKENLEVVSHNINFVNHIHISEPNLKPIEKREIHKELAELLNEKSYKNFISIEMGKCEDVQQVKHIIEYVKEVFK